MLLSRCWILLVMGLQCYALVTGLESFESERYIVLQIQRLGLANRLRTVADMYNIAVLSNRTLLLSWVPTAECNITFLELFEDGPTSFKVLQDPLPKEDTNKTVHDMAVSAGLTFMTLDDNTFDFFVDLELFESDTAVIYTDYSGVVAIKNTPCQYYLTMHSKFYGGLRPVKAVRDIVNNILQIFDKNIMIGVHVRMHNPLYDWEIVPPGPGEARASAFGQKHATLSDFIAQMDAISSNFPALSLSSTSTKGSHRGPLHRFFITSNDVDTKSALQQRYPDAVSLDSATIARDEGEGMLVALVEWLILANSDLLVHTYGSSFATEAAQVHRRPLIGLWGGVSVYHHDERLPFCGHNQYMRLGSSLGKPVSYVEGTHDNRQVDGKAMRLTECPLMAAWGILNVYCNVDEK